jgi:SAM-dependent methyltransferase
MSESDRGYSEQGREDRLAYDRYLSGMDASMRQKVALTAAFLLGRGRVADMGMGSGTGSDALAGLDPELEGIGVDIDRTMVELAAERYRRTNLRFVHGDIGAAVFEDSSLDAIFDSSVLHHVTSFNGYRYEAAAEALAVQVKALREHGVLVVRDFLDPGADPVWLELPTDDGDASSDPRTCSSAALFERFAREFRSLSDAPGFALEVDGEPAPARRRYRTTRKLAVEFLLRKDYREDWESEVKEEYTYFTQADFEARFRELGLRVLSSTPLHNPWILRNRFRGRFAWYDAGGAPLDFPATNYVVVGEKVGPGEGVRFVSSECGPLGFLEFACYERRDSGQVLDLVRRPNATIDLLPFYESRGELFVLARLSYPRPILSVELEGVSSIDGSRAPHYVTEPINLIQGDKPLAQSAEELLTRDLGISNDAITSFSAGGSYYPSPGGVQEEVHSLLVEIEPTPVAPRVTPRSGFSTSGRIGAIEARQLLRAAEVGGLADARLELNVYEILLRRGLSPGPWIAETITLSDRDPPERVSSSTKLRARPSRRRFARVDAGRSTGFLELSCRTFREEDAAGRVVAEKSLEFVIPRRLSTNTAAVLLLRRSGPNIYVALDDDDRPAAQCFTGNSELLVTPAYRLPKEVRSRRAVEKFVLQALARDYDVECGELWELGGRYYPTPGLTSEVVHPFAVEVTGWSKPEGAGFASTLHWVKLKDLVQAGRDLLRDGHTRALCLRAAHALGVLG